MNFKKITETKHFRTVFKITIKKMLFIVFSKSRWKPCNPYNGKLSRCVAAMRPKGHLDYFTNTNTSTQVHKYTNTQLHRCSNTQMHIYANVQKNYENTPSRCVAVMGPKGHLAWGKRKVHNSKDEGWYFSNKTKVQIILSYHICVCVCIQLMW